MINILANKTLNGRKVTVGIQISERNRPGSRASGRFFGMLEAQKADTTNFKLDYIRKNGAIIKIIARFTVGAQRPVAIANWESPTGWSLVEAQWPLSGLDARKALGDLAVAENL